MIEGLVRKAAFERGNTQSDHRDSASQWPANVCVTGRKLQSSTYGGRFYRNRFVTDRLPRSRRARIRKTDSVLEECIQRVREISESETVS